MFDFENEIRKWKKKLRKNRALEDGYIEELEQHLRDEIERNVNTGMSEEKAFEKATENVGNVETVNAEYFKTDTTNRISGRPLWQNPPWIPSLLWNYIKIAVRNINKYKTYSLINIIGFAISLVPVFFILLYISYELSYDKHNENYHRIYRIINDRGAIMPIPLAAALKAEIPEIEEAVRMRGGSQFLAYNGNRTLEKNVLSADPGIFKMFTFDFIQGNPEAVFKEKYSIVFSESMAKKYFGDQNPIGEIIKLRNVYTLKVTGVYKDLPETSHFDANFVIPVSLTSGSGADLGIAMDEYSWGMSMYFTYVLLKENTNPELFVGKINDIIEKYAGKGSYKHLTFSTQPLENIHLFSNYKTELKRNGDITTIYLYTSLALIMLIIAVINYVNLSTARSSRRIKEVGVRKIIGAQKFQLVKQLITETLFITLVSFIFTLIIVSFTLQYFNEFVGRNINLSFSDNVSVIFGLLAVIIIISLLAGIYPSLVLSSIKPLSFFSGDSVTSRKRNFRSVLIVVQFIFTIVLIFISVVINKQMDYTLNKDLGIAKDNIVTVHLSERISKSRLDAFKNELLSDPNILKVSSSLNLPINPASGGWLNWPGKPDDIHITMNYNCVDFDFIDLYEMKIIEGRKFSEDHPADAKEALILSEAAVREIGWDNPIGKIIKHTNPNGTEKRTVIGVVKDFHMHSLHKAITPYYLVIDENVRDYNLSIKVSPNNFAETINFIKEKTEELQPGVEFSYSLFTDYLQNNYVAEFKLKTLFSLFAVFVILIACLGLYGLISFTTEVRQKEIGIRKVLGASSLQIGGKLLNEMMVLIIVSSVLAAPIAFYAADYWLSDFAYRTNVGFGLFLFTIVAVCFIAVLAMFSQVHKASVQNPVKTLKYE